MSKKSATYQAVIGLEIHIQLLTNRKMFAEEGSVYGAPPNTQVSATTLAHPGTMPTVNSAAISHGIMMGLACKSGITRYNLFDRKNYFYPDLPKGYQITQHKTPLCVGGYLTIPTAAGEEKTIRLERIHLEEDTGKMIHMAKGGVTLVNFDRAGTPLIELVTRPDFESAEEVYHFLTKVRRLVRYLGICDGNMEEGSLRCDANVSLTMKGSGIAGKRVELKNMNSIRHAMQAIEHEIERQTALLEGGEEVVSQTRSYDLQTGTTTFLRLKETSSDYRYFPEPDISPIIVEETWIEEVQAKMPVLPWQLFKRFTTCYGLPSEDAAVLVEEKAFGLFFEEVCQLTTQYKGAANWMIGPLRSYLNQERRGIEECPLLPAAIAALADLVAEGAVSFTTAAADLFPLLLQQPTAVPRTLAAERGWIQVSDEAQLEGWVDEAIAQDPAKVAAYRKGKEGLISFFMGRVMELSKKKAHPAKAMALLKERLKAPD